MVYPQYPHDLNLFLQGVKSLLLPEDMERYINLKPFINSSPYTAYDVSIELNGMC